MRRYLAKLPDGTEHRAVGLGPMLAILAPYGVRAKPMSVRNYLSLGNGQATLASQAGAIALSIDTEAETTQQSGPWYGRVQLIPKMGEPKARETLPAADTVLELIGYAAAYGEREFGYLPAAWSRELVEAGLSSVLSRIEEEASKLAPWVSLSLPPAPFSVTWQGSDWVMVVDIATTHGPISPWEQPTDSKRGGLQRR